MRIMFAAYTVICVTCAAALLWQRLLLIESRSLLAGQLWSNMFIERILKTEHHESAVKLVRRSQDDIVRYYYDRNVHEANAAGVIGFYCFHAKDRISQGEIDALTRFSKSLSEKYEKDADINYYNVEYETISRFAFLLFYPEFESSLSYFKRKAEREGEQAIKGD